MKIVFSIYSWGKVKYIKEQKNNTKDCPNSRHTPTRHSKDGPLDSMALYNIQNSKNKLEYKSPKVVTKRPKKPKKTGKCKQTAHNKMDINARIKLAQVNKPSQRASQANLEEVDFSRVNSVDNCEN